MRSNRELGGVEAVGVAQHEPLGEQVVRALGVGQIGRLEQLADLGERLVVAPERDEHTEHQVEPAGAAAGELRARLPRPRGDPEALGGPLEVVAVVGVHARTRRAPGERGRYVWPSPSPSSRRVSSDDALGRPRRRPGSGGRGPTRPPPDGGPAAAPRRPARRRGRCRRPRRRGARAGGSRRHAAAAAPGRARPTSRAGRAGSSIDCGSMVSATDSRELHASCSSPARGRRRRAPA